MPAPADDIVDVSFRLNRVLVQTERFTPYDMGGGTTTEARPFDLSTLAAGSHEVEALVRRGDGTSVPVLASFDKQMFGFTLTTVDSVGGRFFDFDASIAIGADGLPVVSFYDVTNGDLKVAHCGNVTCTAGNTLTTVAGNVGAASSIAIGAEGLPVLSYSVGAAGLKVAHCGNVTCTAGNTLTTVDTVPVNGGAGTSIAIGADGLPVVSYQHNMMIGDQDLKVAHCGNVTCTAGNTLTTLYCPRVLGQWFDGIRFYAAASSPRMSRRTWAGLR